MVKLNSLSFMSTCAALTSCARAHEAPIAAVSCAAPNRRKSAPTSIAAPKSQ
ncbi:hypothetical protein PR003_g12259 [Phytophthora rubi]|uniref:Uncharacterized protein n=2 Tax=Phytophthora TaxID=4783 RepID=A0A6A3KEA8_9STRA|nr:hypothetical protein PF011_g12681 [Phytophthora fragariae]KAE9022930.1 hypothetical protein PR002_g11857 [Phytophthora rubi]KAE9029243.1 hypothetical protein PR001_g11551 [Phytophthora rubi]KAE9329826.1 hypothetical protein PF008_g15846 [Phytophthora fragariae]KAE9336957.1 hypothetical protein PR003_g12259 [Phytophthora rubi]